MTELKPCPFCGGEARLIEAECGTTIHAVECVLCQAKIGWFDEKERAIEAWNNRSNWHTGTPTEEGIYVCRMNTDYAPWLVLDWKNGMWFVNGTTQSFSDDGDVVKWQKIEEGEEV